MYREALHKASSFEVIEDFIQDTSYCHRENLILLRIEAKILSLFLRSLIKKENERAITNQKIILKS